MLILNFGVNEVIYVDDNIIITHCGFTMQRQVRLGFKAPKHINIIRKEVLDKLAEKKQDKFNGNI